MVAKFCVSVSDKFSGALLLFCPISPIVFPGTFLQLFEVTVCDVMAAPVRDSIELNAVREAHFVPLVEPPALRGPFVCVAAITATVTVTVTVTATATTTDRDSGGRTLRGRVEVSTRVTIEGIFKVCAIWCWPSWVVGKLEL